MGKMIRFDCWFLC